MKTLLIYLALFTGQMNTLHDRPVVYLPAVPPKFDLQGNPWSVDVKNLGPTVVTIIGKAQFSEPVNPGQTLHIHSNGAIYSLTH
jgi:hypothetical protein